MELAGLFSRPRRDPRGGVVSAAFVSLVDADRITLQAGDDAADARWYAIEGSKDQLVLRNVDAAVPAAELAFDHAEVLTRALEQLDLLP